jgi:hypothetical protein
MQPLGRQHRAVLARLRFPAAKYTSTRARFPSASCRSFSTSTTRWSDMGNGDRLAPSEGIISSAADIFLDIPNHLPFPATYASLIVIATVLLRLTTTLPLSIWQRRRTRRMEQFVVPELLAVSESVQREHYDLAKRQGKTFAQFKAAVTLAVRSPYSQTDRDGHSTCNYRCARRERN